MTQTITILQDDHIFYGVRSTTSNPRAEP